MADKEFKYTYSAPTAEEKKEILKIQRQYQPQEESKDEKVTQLKKLDNAVKVPAKVVSILMGAIGFCCFGLGMTMSLEWQLLLWGTVLGVVGLVLMAFAYPVYNKIFATRKAKYGERILDLSQTLLTDSEDNNVSLDIKQAPKDENQR